MKDNDNKPHADHVLHLTVNENKYKWHQQYITGLEIKKLANIPLEDDLFLKVEKGWDDELITNEAKVDLARKTTEHFYSKEHCEFPISGTPSKNDHLVNRIPLVDEDENNEYVTNIQIADLNSLNAGFAVVKWKKMCGFYQDLEEEHHTTYSINVSQLLNEDEVAA